MSFSGFKEFSDALRVSLRDLSPDFVSDVTDKGEDVLLVTVRNPHNPYWGAAYECGTDKYGHIAGNLWFGQCEVTSGLDASDAEAAIRSVVNGEIVAVVRYRDEEDCEDRHPAGWQRVFQLLPDGQDDDSAAFSVLMSKLRSKPGFFDRFDRNTLGVFEIARWEEVSVLRRGKVVKNDKQPKNDDNTENNSANNTNESI